MYHHGQRCIKYDKHHDVIFLNIFHMEIFIGLFFNHCSSKNIINQTFCVIPVPDRTTVHWIGAELPLRYEVLIKATD